MLVVNGAGWTGKIVYFIHFDIEREADVMPDELEIGVIEQGNNVAFCSGKEIVDANDLMAIPEKLLAQVPSQESCASGN
jgi:hypothetical protein